MPFNPNDWEDVPQPKGAPAPGGAINAADWEDAPANAEEPSTLTALGRSLRQGATFGLYDEGRAALGSLFGEGDYKSIRDKIRAEDKAAQKAHPWAYGAGEIAGGFVPGLLTAGASTGASLARTVGTAAVEGAVSGFGHSEGETAADIAKDTVVGGATGAGTSFVLGKLARNITGRARARAVGDLNEDVVQGANGVKALPTDQKRVAMAEENIFETLKDDPKLRNALGNTSKAKDMIEARKEALGTTLDDAYHAFDKEIGGVRVGSVVDGLNERLATLEENPGHIPEKTALKEMIEDLTSSWSKRVTNDKGVTSRVWDPDRMVPTKALRKYTTDLQGTASNTLGSLNETERYALKKNLSDQVKNILDQHLDNGARSVPELQSVVDTIRTTNRQYSALSTIDRALTTRANKELVKGKGFGASLKEAGNGLGYLYTIPQALQGHVGPLAVQLGAKVAAPALERSAKTTNFAVARLVEAAKNGSTAAQLGKKAIELGLPASVGIGLANAYTGRRKTSELDELEEGTEAL